MELAWMHDRYEKKGMERQEHGGNECKAAFFAQLQFRLAEFSEWGQTIINAAGLNPLPQAENQTVLRMVSDVGVVQFHGVCRRDSCRHYCESNIENTAWM
jgi:hypothetical protein